MQSFLNWCKVRKPLVTLKMAVDAHNRVDEWNETSRRFTTLDSLKFAHHLRRQVDAILVGSHTVIRDNPNLTIRNVELNGATNPVRIVLDTRGKITNDVNIWNSDAKTLRICGSENLPSIDGIESISSVSRDGRSKVSIEFITDKFQ